jgi:4-hydroxy-tetrahydrodipicolinate synthase
MFKGITNALVTPFNEDSSIDYVALKSLIVWHIDSGIKNFLLLGSTGEGQTIGNSEREELINFVLTNFRDQINLMVGIGTSCTKTTADLALQAKKLGVDAVLIVAPFYNKPTQNGIYEHIKYVNDNVEIPIYLYNNPSRAVVEFSDNTIYKLMELKNVVGIKDSLSNPVRFLNLIKYRNAHRNDFELLCGDDQMVLNYMLLGGDGLISVNGNALPDKMASIMNYLMHSRYTEAMEEYYSIANLVNAVFAETNPICLKYLLYRLNKCKNTLRLPLVPASQEAMSKVDSELSSMLG